MEYSKSNLQIALKEINENKKNNTINFYDNVLFNSLKLHIVNLINYINNIEECPGEKTCTFSKFINSFSFEVITIDFIDINLKLKVQHSLLHQYIDEYIEYYNLKEYTKALNILQKFLSIIHEIINLYFTVSNNFKEIPEKYFYKYIKQTHNTSALIVNYTNKKFFYFK